MRSSNLMRATGVSALITLAVAASAAAETYRLSHNTSDATSWHKGSERFAELLEERSGGEMSVRIFPNATLTGGDQMKQAEMVGRGALDFVVTSAINVTPLIPEMAVFSLPYLYSSYEEVDATTQGEPGERIAEIMEQHGIVVLGWGENGFREVTNNTRPIQSPEDMKGLKMRVAGPMYIDVMNALGANPQQMQWVEVYSALQQGVVDGQENPIGAVIVPQRVYEVQKYLTTWHYSYDPVFLGVSKQLWESWDEGSRALVEGAAKEAMEYQRQLTREETDKGLEVLRGHGVEIYEPTEEEIAAFKEATQPAFDTWSERVGPELVTLFQETIEQAPAN